MMPDLVTSPDRLEPAIEPDRYLQVLRAAYATQYHDGTDEWTADPSMRCLPALVQGYLKFAPDSRILDIGCGAGDDVAYFATFAGAVVGIDIYRQAGWERIARNRDTIRFHCSDLLSFRSDRAFDVVVDNGCFHHQHPLQRGTYLRKASALLDPQGTFVMSTFKNPGRPDHIDALGRLHAYLDDAEVHDLLDQAGYGVVHEVDVYRAVKRDYYRVTFSRLSR